MRDNFHLLLIFSFSKGHEPRIIKNIPDEGSCYEKTINDIEIILFDIRNGHPRRRAMLKKTKNYIEIILFGLINDY